MQEKEGKTPHFFYKLSPERGRLVQRRLLKQLSILAYKVMDLHKIEKLAKLYVTAASGYNHPHYKQVYDLFNQVGNVARAMGTEVSGAADRLLSQRIQYIHGLAKRLMYNADNFGLSKDTSERYGNEIKVGLSEIDDMSRNNHPAVSSAVQAARLAANVYQPQAMPSPKAAAPAPVQPEAPAQQEVPVGNAGERPGVNQSIDTSPNMTPANPSVFNN